MRALVGALAAKLEDALPEATRVQRRSRGLLRRKGPVVGLDVSVGEDTYALRLDGGAVLARRTKTVRGIAIKSEQLPLDGWLDALTADLAAEAERSEAGRLALERLLR